MRRRTLLRTLALLPPSVALAMHTRRAFGGQAAPRLVADERTFYPLFADRDRLYWMVSDGIRSVSKRGGKPTPALSGNLDPLALYGDRLVFEERLPGAGLSVEPKTTIKMCRTSALGEVTTLATGRRMLHAATADASGIYFHELQDQDPQLMLLFHLPWSGGSAREIAEVCLEPWATVADATHLYWGSGEGQVYAVPKKGGVPDVIGSGELGIAGLAIDDEFAYFTHDEAGTLSRAPKRGGKTVKLATARKSTQHDDLDLRGRLEKVVLRGPYVYYVDNDIYARNAAVRRVPRSGGRPETVIERRGCGIEDLIADEKQWFWVESIEKNGAETRRPIMSLPL